MSVDTCQAGPLARLDFFVWRFVVRRRAETFRV